LPTCPGTRSAANPKPLVRETESKAMDTNLRILLVACLLVAASQAAWGQAEMDRLSWADGLEAADPAPLPAPSRWFFVSQVAGPPSEV